MSPLRSIIIWAKANILPLMVLGVGSLVALWVLAETFEAGNTGFDNKTLWDWLELLIIPIVLAVGVWWLNRVEKRTELKISSTALEEEALQTYFDRMSTLLIDSKLRQSTRGDEARSIARSRTLTIVRRLNGTRKGLLLRFLYEAELIKKGAQIISLRGAELDLAELAKANLRWSDLSWSSLKRANFTKSLLHGANLTGAQLSESNFKDARLVGATLRMANLSAAMLTGADLSSADLQDATCIEAELRHATIGGANLRGANLSGCDLSNSDLSGADLTRSNLNNAKLNGTKLAKAVLIGASLESAELIGAQFDDADLSLANLRNAKVDLEQLKSARALLVTTMPNGVEIWNQ